MTKETLRKQTIRQAKEEGNYASFSKFLRYDNKYKIKSNLITLYNVLKQSKGTEDKGYIFFNGRWECIADIFKKLGLKFNKECGFIKKEYETSNRKETS